VELPTASEKQSARMTIRDLATHAADKLIQGPAGCPQTDIHLLTVGSTRLAPRRLSLLNGFRLSKAISFSINLIEAGVDPRKPRTTDSGNSKEKLLDLP